MFGRQGDDTYVFGRGDGQDIINEESVIEANVDGGSDTIVFADYTGNPGYGGEQAIGLSNLNFAFAGNDLIISLKGPRIKSRL
ncbi:hypothetical protein E6W36_11620 [Hankyongella ginsenosidimutans]|uniref:Calcium-binding protein n=1 Tax=Hankyongella ginsenosidimutans TaxID=1763828 RepID=A0A4D7C8S7_9SPHN|nr:hypothetical protein E6W36_11620 [Hankyongella ginsenosidimutans]